MIRHVILLLLSLSTVPQAKEPVVIIAHKQVADDSVSAADLEKIFTIGRQRWKNGQKIVVYNLKSDAPSKSRVYKYIHKKPLELRKTWLRIQLTGEGKAPIAVKTEAELLSKVSSTPGAIGYIRAESVDASVKILATIR